LASAIDLTASHSDFGAMHAVPRPNRAARLVLTRLLVLVLTRRLLHQHPDRRAFAPVASAVRA
jgi:hypothetical protein